MNGVFQRASGLFLDPPAPTPLRETEPAAWDAPAAAGHVPSVAVLGAPRDTLPLAHALAAELRGRSRADCALIGEWRGETSALARPGRSTRAARSLAVRLAARELEAKPRGRAVVVALPADAATATAAWRRAVVAAQRPAVLALTGPRPAAFDPLLDDHDLLVLVPPAGAPPALAELGLAGVAGLRPPVVTARPPALAAARLAGCSSIAVSRALGPVLTDALRRLA